MQRSDTQNKSLHLYCEHLAQELNDAGFDMRKALRHDIDISWNKQMVKEYIWRPVQESLFQKNSTTELNRQEVNEVWMHLNRFVSEKFGLYVPFPSEENKPDYPYDYKEPKL
jgi:hypothetical protein